MAEKVENYFYIEAISAALRTHFPGIDRLKPQQEEAVINFMQRCIIKEMYLQYYLQAGASH